MKITALAEEPAQQAAKVKPPSFCAWDMCPFDDDNMDILAPKTTWFAVRTLQRWPEHSTECCSILINFHHCFIIFCHFSSSFPIFPYLSTSVHVFHCLSVTEFSSPLGARHVQCFLLALHTWWRPRCTSSCWDCCIPIDQELHIFAEHLRTSDI